MLSRKALLTITQVKSLKQKVLESKGVILKDAHILWALRSRSADGDVKIAYDLLVAISNASEGIVSPFDPTMKLKGAVNRNAVTCFLDSTLFSMFSRLDSFEAMLYNSFDDVKKERLAFLLRLWVNLLRSGELITTDITKQIQESLADCGWEDARELHQQDASEAFTFITERLNLPLLTLKMDIYHTGKQDTDDHRFINERLLEVAIPTLEDGSHPKEIKLEDCLEEYFNNRIEVKRYLERRNTLQSTYSNDSKAKEMGMSVHVEAVEVDSDIATPLTPMTPNAGYLSQRPTNRTRGSSIIQERYIPEGAPLSGSPRQENKGPLGRLRQGSLRKEVLMPAWQFFSLIPWYTDHAPSSDAQVAAHFSSKRPVLGLCLKRYSFTNSGRAIRLDTYVDIPIEIGLPHFIQDDKMDESGPIYGNFKLSLQSVVCHRGVSVDSGHYVALVRSTGTKGSEGEVSDWLRFDDLANPRVSLIDINRALKEETPYLLFYQILPVEGDPGNLTAGEQAPPAYEPSGQKPQTVAAGEAASKTEPAENTISKTSSDEQPISSRPSIDASSTDDTRGRTPELAAQRRPSAISFPDHLAQPTPRKSVEIGREAHTIEHKKSGSFNTGLAKTFSRLGMTSSKKTSKEDVSAIESSPERQAGPQITVERVDTVEPGRRASGPHIHERGDSIGASDEVLFTPRNKSDSALTTPVSQTVGGSSTATGNAGGIGVGRSRSKREKSRGRKLGKSKSGDPDRECVVM